MCRNVYGANLLIKCLNSFTSSFHDFISISFSLYHVIMPSLSVRSGRFLPVCGLEGIGCLVKIKREHFLIILRTCKYLTCLEIREFEFASKMFITKIFGHYTEKPNVTIIF